MPSAIAQMLTSIVSGFDGSDSQVSVDEQSKEDRSPSPTNPLPPTSQIYVTESRKRNRSRSEEYLRGEPSKSLKIRVPAPDVQEMGSGENWRRHYDGFPQAQSDQARRVVMEQQNQQLKLALDPKQRPDNVFGKDLVVGVGLEVSERPTTIPGALAKRMTQLIRENLALTKERDKYRQAYHQMQEENNLLNNVCFKRQAELDTQTREQLTIKKQLDACKADLFRTKPQAALPDSVFITEFVLLCEQIAGWVDGEAYRFTKDHPESVPGQMYFPGRGTYSKLLLAKYPDAGEFLVRHMVHMCLCTTIFDDGVYHLGLSDDQNRFLKDVESAMKEKTPAKGEESFGKWRVNAIKAYSGSRKAIDSVHWKLQDVSEMIFDTIRPIFPIIEIHEDSKSKIFDEIVLPASRLAAKIHESPFQFQFSMPKAMEIGLEPFMDIEFHTVRILDSKSGEVVKSDCVVTRDKDGLLGTRIIQLEPAFRRISELGKIIVLRRALLLVDLKFPVEKRSSASRKKLAARQEVAANSDHELS